MLDSALVAIAKNLNLYLRNRFGLIKDRVQLANVVRSDDAGANDNAEKITITLINLKEEKNLKNVPPNPSTSPIYFNMYILIAVYFGEDGSYEQSLKELSAVISYFQANQIFTPQNTPDLDARIDRLIFKLENLDFQELQNIWAMLGGKYAPSVVYKVNTIVIYEDAPPMMGGFIGIKQ